MSHENDQSYDVIILGAGPAGLQAAIHAARKKVSVLVLGRPQASSLAGAHVANFCCLGTISGEHMLEMGLAQAQESGAEVEYEDVLGIEQLPDQSLVVKTESGRRLACLSLVLAMGISRHKLGVPGEKELLGKGVSYCVDCDGGFFRGERVAVVGSASAALSGALTLLLIAAEVHLVCDQLKAVDSLVAQVKASDIKLHTGREVKRVLGEKQVEGLELDDGAVLDVAGVFIELGAKGAVELAASLGVRLDDEKFQYVVADKRQRTNLPGIFAAGDITGPPWQVAKAVGEGCVAGIEAADHAKRARQG